MTELIIKLMQDKVGEAPTWDETRPDEEQLNKWKAWSMKKRMLLGAMAALKAHNEAQARK